MDIVPRTLEGWLVPTAPDSPERWDFSRDLPSSFKCCVLRTNGGKSSEIYFFTSETKARNHFKPQLLAPFSPVMDRAWGLEIVKWARGDYHPLAR
jgi:hypothetical protein